MGCSVQPSVTTFRSFFLGLQQERLGSFSIREACTNLSSSSVGIVLTPGFLGPENNPLGGGKLQRCGIGAKFEIQGLTTSLKAFNQLSLFILPQHISLSSDKSCQFLSSLRMKGSRVEQVVPRLTTVNLGYGFLGPAKSAISCLLASQFLKCYCCSLLFFLFLWIYVYFFKNPFTIVLVPYQEGGKLDSCAQSIIFTESLNFLCRKSLHLLLRTVFSLLFNSYSFFSFLLVISHRPSGAMLNTDAVVGIFALVLTFVGMILKCLPCCL